jgi:dTDP-4-dehydrorhamnose reductase
VGHENKKILIIGGSGYIGGHLSSVLGNKYEVFSTYLSHRRGIAGCNAIQLDIRDGDSVKKVHRTVLPDIVYLLAYSLSDMEGTIIQGASHVMKSAEYSKPRIIFLSTDVVFSGIKNRYYENDMPDAINNYGRAKSRAEKTVLENGGFVVRTSLVYGFEPMDDRTSQLIKDLRTGETKTEYFYDEYRCPIFVHDLCNMLLALADIDSPRILHMAGSECMSRLEFARRLAVAFGFDETQVRTMSQKESCLKRPLFLFMDSELTQKVLHYRIRPLEEILAGYILSRQTQTRELK